MWMWRCCCVGFVLLCGVLFTPWVIPVAQHSPMLWGIPYTLWLGFIIANGFVLLTIIGSLCQPLDDTEV